MPGPVTVRLEGLDELQRKLGADFRPVMRGATKAIAAEIQGKVAPYPPATEANSPARQRWYERGYGPKRRMRDGRIKGYKTSEILRDAWTIVNYGDIGAKAGNKASYAAFVHDDAKQAPFHKRRGWMSDKSAVEIVQRAGTIGRIMKDAMMHAWRRA
jgi:hypothetical protein